MKNEKVFSGLSAAAERSETAMTAFSLAANSVRNEYGMPPLRRSKDKRPTRIKKRGKRCGYK